MKKKKHSVNENILICQKSVSVGLTILSSFTNGNSLSCISMGNQECKARPQVVNFNRDEPVFFPFSLKHVNVLVAVIRIKNGKIYVPDIIKNLNCNYETKQCEIKDLSEKLLSISCHNKN